MLWKLSYWLGGLLRTIVVPKNSWCFLNKGDSLPALLSSTSSTWASYCQISKKIWPWDTLCSTVHCTTICLLVHVFSIFTMLHFSCVQFYLVPCVFHLINFRVAWPGTKNKGHNPRVFRSQKIDHFLLAIVHLELI